MDLSKLKDYKIEKDTRRLTFTVAEFCCVLASVGAQHNKVPNKLLHDYIERAKRDYLPISEFLLKDQLKHKLKAKVVALDKETTAHEC